MKTKKISGGFTNRADMVSGSPGQYARIGNAMSTVWRSRWWMSCRSSLEIVEPKVPIVRNGSMQLKIVAHKKEGWDEQINVQFPFRPPGIGAASSINIPKGKN